MPKENVDRGGSKYITDKEDVARKVEELEGRCRASEGVNAKLWIVDGFAILEPEIVGLLPQYTDDVKGVQLGYSPVNNFLFINRPIFDSELDDKFEDAFTLTLDEARGRFRTVFHSSELQHQR